MLVVGLKNLKISYIKTIALKVKRSLTWAKVSTLSPDKQLSTVPWRQGRSDGGISVFIPPKSAQVNFLWSKNDARTAIQQFYTPPQKKKLLYPNPQKKFLATPLPDAT